MWQYQHTDTLCHYGIKGMRWGVRRSEAQLNRARGPSGKKVKKTKTELTPEQKKARNKKIATGVLATIGTAAVVAGTVAYVKNKDKVDASVKNYFTKRKPTAEEKAATNRMKEDVKRRRTLSDAELKKKIDRIKMERELKNLSAEELNPGRKAVGDILGSAGKKAATTMATGAILYGVKAALTKKANAQDAAGYITPKPKNK